MKTPFPLSRSTNWRCEAEPLDDGAVTVRTVVAGRIVVLDVPSDGSPVLTRVFDDEGGGIVRVSESYIGGTSIERHADVVDFPVAHYPSTFPEAA